ncbi:MAG: PEP-CTERM sorting domain-containing protein [Telluria sp.]
MSIKLIFSIAASAAALCMHLPAKAQSLTGSQVTGAAYCCNSPNESDRVTNLLATTVGTGIEFPVGSFVDIGTQLETVPASIDFGANSLEIVYSEAATAAPGLFNGYVFTFTGAPAIVAVDIDPSSTYFPVLTFNQNTIFVNEAGFEFTPASRLLVNISAVPEPSAYALFFGGLALVAFAGRKASRSIAASG